MKQQNSELGVVFYASLGFAIAFLVWGALFTGNLSTVTSGILSFVISSFGWLYLIATTLFLAFLAFLAFSRFGKVRLGKDDEEPEFGRASWFAMLFAAGMGTGLVFWGVAEPISHLSTPPYQMAEPGSAAAAELGMRYSYFHWGLHPWAVYGTVALALAYFTFRRDGGGLISSIFRPLLGDRVDGPIGKGIDILGIIATLFGVAVSLGFGSLQVNGGLSYLFDVPNNAGAQIVIILIITVLFMMSAITGIGRGIRYLSNVNMVLAAFLLLFVFVFGPTVFIVDTFTQMVGNYAGALIPMSFNQNVFASDGTWAQNWTLFYWATWIAWAPFVGSFIARISRGRTIREFIVAVLFVPSIVSFFWFSTLGGTAIQLVREGGANAITEAVGNNVATALFVTFDRLPGSFITSVVAIFLVSVFFITSADSASFVLASMTTGGNLNPPTFVKLVWGAVIASFAGVLLLAGGLDALQKVAIIAAVPFAVIMIAMCFSLYKALLKEPKPNKAEKPSIETLKEKAAESMPGKAATGAKD
ncbi:MAG TPA: BCCT family transporter [Ornithinimicrobium sp.]|uniref:BCCT family transporter n=1 Tax=Ornithinimicrobium sp. TaxID=1977084 RepID=UPI002B466029|nr:BCCT family transporter [Ornithinimicrobium sp.]HKJ12698.1 BCCT family transporter [Ornithinimicrobium sp.]